MDVKLAELLSKNGGKLPRYVTKEAYPVYYLTTQGVTLCPYCANLILLEDSKKLGTKIKASDLSDYKINWDNYNLVCKCGHKIDSATIELDIPTRIGEINNDTSKREIPYKIGHIKLHSTRKQTGARH